MFKEGYKMSEEHKRKIGLTNSVKTREYWKNHPEHKERMRLSHLGKPSSMKGRKGKPSWNKGLKGYKAGEKHYNWKGGITSLELQIRHLFEYRQWRSDIFTRDDFTCQECSKRGGNLEAHHCPKSFSEIMKEYKIITLKQALNCEELWNINNGKTLCQRCHNKTKSRRLKL